MPKKIKIESQYNTPTQFTFTKSSKIKRKHRFSFFLNIIKIMLNIFKFVFKKARIILNTFSLSKQKEDFLN